MPSASKPHDSDATSLTSVLHACRIVLAAPQCARHEINQRIDELCYALPLHVTRRLALCIVAVSMITSTLLSSSLFTDTVYAQSAANEASSAMCATGLGALLTYVFGFVAVMLILISGLRGAIAWNNMGSARKDKKRQGREQLKGAGITLVGAFFPAIFAVGLDKAGINTLSCVNFGNVLVLAPSALL